MKRTTQFPCLGIKPLAASDPETPSANGVAPLHSSVGATPRLDQLLHLAIGENDAAETAQAGLWLEYAVEYGHRSLVAQEEYA